MTRAAIVAVLAAAACADPAEVRAFRFTAPGAAVEVVPVPGQTLAIAWTADSDGDVDVELALRPTTPPGPALALGSAPIDDGALTWTVPDPAPRGGIHQLAAILRSGPLVIDEVTATTIVVVQGAEFRDATLSFTGADVDRDLWITVTTASVIDVEVYLAAAPEAARLVIARASVASDLAPIGRVFRFSGQTVDGAAIPAGDHLGFLEVRDRATAYVRGGLSLRWQP